MEVRTARDAYIWVRSAPQKVRLEKIASGEFGDLHQTDQGV